MSRNLYVTGTRKGVGKTTITVGLTSAIKRKVPNIGFIKPLGTRDISRTGYFLDEDTLLVHKACDVHSSLQDASPITVMRGFPTEVVPEESGEALLKRIEDAFARVSDGRDIVIIEGAGHAAVGSILGISNALVAARLKAKVVLVTTEQTGHPVDEITLNRAFYEKHGVEVIGAILNQVPLQQLKQIRDATRDLLARHGIRLLGTLPPFRILARPTLLQIAEFLDGQPLCARPRMSNRFRRTLLGAMSAATAFPRLFDVGEENLLITPGDRTDMILAALQAHQAMARDSRLLLSGIILTGGIVPDPLTIDCLEKAEIPAIAVEVDSFTAASRIHDFHPTVSPHDRKALKVIHQAVAKYIDVDAIVEHL